MMKNERSGDRLGGFGAKLFARERVGAGLALAIALVGRSRRFAAPFRSRAISPPLWATEISSLKSSLVRLLASPSPPFKVATRRASSSNKLEQQQQQQQQQQRQHQRPLASATGGRRAQKSNRFQRQFRRSQQEVRMGRALSSALTLARSPSLRSRCATRQRPARRSARANPDLFAPLLLGQ